MEGERRNFRKIASYTAYYLLFPLDQEKGKDVYFYST